MRAGCRSCGDVIESRDPPEVVMCRCRGVAVTPYGDYIVGHGSVVPLPTVADKLAFKMDFAGRGDEAAVVREMKP